MVSILSISKGENGLLQVLIPILVLLFKKIPLIGGNIKAGLLLAGALTLLFAGIINPAIWISSWIDGLNRLSWIIFLSLFGSLFAEVNNQMGAIDTIVGSDAGRLTAGGLDCGRYRNWNAYIWYPGFHEFGV